MPTSARAGRSNYRPSTFSTSKYPEIIAAIGKEGYMYLLNADNLGGLRPGA